MQHRLTRAGACRLRGLLGQLLAALLALLVLAAPAGAVQPDEVLADAALEARARAISAELRCLVCQNQSIDDSNAPLARDLRLLVRERLVAGDSDGAVRAFVVERYGQFVLLRPPVGPSTWLLWAMPLLLLGGTALAVAARLRTRGAHPETAAAAAPLTTEEQARLERILAGDASKPS